MGNLRIAIGADHGGFKLKEKIIKYLKDENIEFKDFGTFDEEACNYPDVAKKVASEVSKDTFDRGILVCGTGIGMSIVANKQKGIRAALCSDLFSAQASRGHNDSNILCLGQRVISDELALEIVDIWLKSEFEGGRHKIRVDLIEG